MSPSFGSTSPSCNTTPTPSKGKNSTATNANGRAVKKRASKACQCCRARKVRCNVVEHGPPCRNCTFDEAECIVTKSTRRKNPNFPPKLDAISKHTHTQNHSNSHHSYPLSVADELISGNVETLDMNPHILYATQMASRGVYSSFTPVNRPIQFMNGIVSAVSLHGDLTSTRLQTLPETIPPIRAPAPAYIKPIPSCMTLDDINYLWEKGALSIPERSFRNALLRAYAEFVHPYIPLIDLHGLLEIVNDNTGSTGKVSLLLFQAVLFTGTAFVDKRYLESVGYITRKQASKAFYLKARLLYDFDYEIDRVVLVQSLLLMTFWYETPDDQKDTWHWMGVTISLAQTIGLHRDPEKSHMDAKKQKLWKRIWWSCFMRDRLVALGMRRPTRIKDEDYDVPMLTLNDFEIQALSPDNSIISEDCVLMRDLQMQRDLAMICIFKAKLSLTISHVLGAQYSVLVRDQGTGQGQEGNTRTSVLLFPKKHNHTDEVQVCDAELNEWIESIPPPYEYHKPTQDEVMSGSSSVVVHRALLHMIYFATVSALHRPQVPSSAGTSSQQNCRDLQDMSRRKVRDASRAITTMSLDLHELKLERFLPATAVTVLLPAIIIHLLDIKSLNQEARIIALGGFKHCMLVLASLRDNYAAADHATQFLDAVIKKANINIGARSTETKNGQTEPMNLDLTRMQTSMSGPYTLPRDSSHETTIGASTPKMGLMTANFPPLSDSQNQNNSDTHHQHFSALHSVVVNGYGDLVADTCEDGHFESHFNDLIDYSASEGDVGGVDIYGLDGGFEGGFGLDMANMAVGAVGAHQESRVWSIDWEAKGLWSPEDAELGGGEGRREEEDGRGEMGKEESAVYLL